MNAMHGFEFFKNFINKQFCYYRTTLSDVERKAYDKIRYGFLSYSKSILVFGLSPSQTQNVFEKIKQDNPWLFYVEAASYQYAPVCQGGSVIPKYRFNKDEVNATLQAIIKKCIAMTTSLKNKTEFEKELEIHNYFCKSIYYDNDFAASSYECVGPLLFGKGVCDGISKAVKLLFDFVDVESLQVCGKSNQQHDSATFLSELHAWNIVKINGAFYHLDVTFDLTVQAFGIVRYDYFNLSDQEVLLDHATLSMSVPKCLTSNNYYKIRDLFLQTQNDYRELLVKSIRKGQRDIVFKLPNSNNIDITKKKIAAVTSEVLSSPFLPLSQYQLISNDSQFVFHLHLS